jgi:hypothetical protein
MKKVVFCCLLFVVSLSRVPRSFAILGNGTYEFDTYDITLSYFRDEHKVRGYYINKYGDIPFSITYQRETGWIELENVQELDGNHVFLGRILETESVQFYKGFLMIYSPEGEFIQELIIEKEVETTIEWIFEVDGLYIAIISGRTGDRDQDRNYIMVFDKEFNLIQETEIYGHFTDMIGTNSMVLYNTDYDDKYDGAFLADLTHIVPTDPLLIATDQVFEGSIHIPFLNQAYLNGEPIHNGVWIEYPGKYTLEYQDYTYTFTVGTEVHGIQDGGIYQDEIQILFDTGKAYLNDDLYVSGEIIEEPGVYTFTVEGLRGYIQEYHFTIDAHVQGVINNQTYSDDVTVDFNGNGYLNDTYITPPYTVTEPGEYVLTITGENNYRDTYYFTVEKEEPSYSIVDFLEQYDIVLLGVTVVSGLLILKKK